MEEHSDFMHSEELQDWIKQRLDTAVKELADQGMVESAVIEAKPAWVMPTAGPAVSTGLSAATRRSRSPTRMSPPRRARQPGISPCSGSWRQPVRALRERAWRSGPRRYSNWSRKRVFGGRGIGVRVKGQSKELVHSDLVKKRAA